MRLFHSRCLEPSEIDALVAERLAWILEVAEASCVLAFGSAGRYDMREDSDIDLIVILPQGIDPAGVAASVLQRRPPHDVSADVLFFNEAEFVRRAELGGVCHIAAREGRVVHGRLPEPKETA